jgi:tetratricopeptide (TPR) repeat protein
MNDDIKKLLEQSKTCAKYGNFEDMIKLYEIAIKNDDSESMYNLGYYYYSVKDYDNMKKYYKMAISKNNSSAMFGFGIYYKNIEKNLQKSAMYLKMAYAYGYNADDDSSSYDSGSDSK